MAVKTIVGRLLRAPENFISDGMIDDIREHGLNADRRDFIRKSFAAASAALVSGHSFAAFEAQITALWVFPIKSCAGLLCQEATLTATGLAWDRCFMVVDAYGEMVTQRDLPRMALIQPELNTAPDVMQMTVRAPGMQSGLLATVPGKAKAVATPMAPVTACEAWQRRGVK